MKKQYNCQNCDVEFVSVKGCATRTPKFCSRRCSALFMTDERREKMSAAKRGKATWNKGVPATEESKRQHSLKMRGRKYPERRGANSPAWRGGISTENERARKTPEYKEWRQKVFERDNFTCQECNRVGGKLHADHIKPFAYFKELRFEVSNGRTLCVECHYKTDTYGSKALKMQNAFPSLEIKRIEQTKEANG